MIDSIVIGVTTIAFSKNEDLISELRSKGFKKVKKNEEGKRFTQSELISFLQDCQAAIVGLDIINEEVLSKLPNLRVISKYGVGLDNIDFDACERYNVKVFFPEGVNKRSVSEMTLGFMLSLCRNLYTTSNLLKNKIWNKSGGIQLSEKTIGVIGVGNVGKDLITLLKPFGCRVLVNDIVSQEEYYLENGLESVSKEEIFSKSDVITIHTPLNEGTMNLFNKEVFLRMKKEAFIINTSRGGVINLNDLKWALKRNEIAGAAIDVYDSEPPEDYELISIPNLMNTPHIGGNSREAVKAMGQAAISNVCNYYDLLVDE
ncbi:phosphoglycerate dehydrogenase [Joostella sp. CR20]|uniref:phosphoglycerate dehydrogenase n=1 Tax=Joostella sp. CR20 TaxID=2804312 RepID=UPI00313EEF72